MTKDAKNSPRKDVTTRPSNRSLCLHTAFALDERIATMCLNTVQVSVYER